MEVSITNPMILWKDRYRNSYLAYYLMYNFYYLSWAMFSALISVYLMGKGYSAGQVSLVVSASFLASMLTQPFIGSLNDKYDFKKVNASMFALAAVGGILFVLSQNIIMIMAAYSFVMILINGSNPVMEKVATAAPYDYGKIRIWGTIGYALGTQCAGLLYDRVAPEAIFVAFVFTMSLCIIGLLGTDPVMRASENAAQESGKTAGIKGLLTNIKYLYFLVILGLFIGVTSFGNTYIPTMLTHDGLSASTASTVLSIAVICEAPLVFFAGKFMDRISNKKLMIIAFSMTILQFAVYAFGLPLPLKIAVTFMAKHPAGMLFIMIKLKVIATIVDDDMQITALAFAMTIQNLVSIVFNNIGGTILDAAGYPFTWRVGLIILLAGFALLMLYRIPSGNDRKLFSYTRANKDVEISGSRRACIYRNTTKRRDR